jgi:hypothetical protein
VRAAEDLAGTLRAEADELTATVEDLDARLAETAARRGDTTAALASALEAGDIAGVRNGRAELAAVDEVAAALAGQLVRRRSVRPPPSPPSAWQSRCTTPAARSSASS